MAPNGDNKTWRIGRIEYSRAEIGKLLMLRSLEWDALPIYGTRFIAPIALLWLRWWQLFLVLVALQFCWDHLKTRFVSFRIAMFINAVNMIRIAILTNGAIAVLFLVRGDILNAILSMLWLLVSSKLQFAELVFVKLRLIDPPVHTGRIIRARMTSELNSLLKLDDPISDCDIPLPEDVK
jgi:hypothetical protein